MNAVRNARMARRTIISSRPIQTANSLAFRIWRRNALKAVVTFTIDRRERVIGLIDQPIESVHPKELKFYIETLARECDRFEYILTGADRQ